MVFIVVVRNVVGMMMLSVMGVMFHIDQTRTGGAFGRLGERGRHE